MNAFSVCWVVVYGVGHFTGKNLEQFLKWGVKLIGETFKGSEKIPRVLRVPKNTFHEKCFDECSYNRIIGI